MGGEDERAVLGDNLKVVPLRMKLKNRSLGRVLR